MSTKHPVSALALIGLVLYSPYAPVAQIRPAWNAPMSNTNGASLANL